METVAQTPSKATVYSRGRSRSSAVSNWGAVATWLLCALLVVYLGLENGGYDPIPRDQVGIAVWWVVLLGVSVEALPVPGRTRPALIVICLLLGFAVWTGLAFIWTESDERTATELARVVAYLGVLVLGICMVTRRRPAAKHVLFGVTSGLALLAFLGVLSRLHMAWFPANELGKALPGIEIERRLSYPLNYSSAMGALAGITLPLLLTATAAARTIAAQAFAAAAIPVVGLALYLSASGTGVGVAVVAMVAFLALAPDRLPKLLTLAVGSGGAALLILATHSRDALSRGLPTPAAEHQGTEVMWIAMGVCAVVALIQVGIGHAVRNLDRPAWLRPSRSQALVATGVALVIAIPIAVAAGLPGEMSDRWDTFKSHGGTPEAGSGNSIFNFNGSGRYQFWESAVDANATDPWIGIGPGTFEFWWARNGSYAGFIRDAHSLYLENLAELGIIGFLLITGFVLAVLGIGSVRSLRGPPEQRLVLAAATAGATGFAMAAALDWVWELAALPAAFMLLAAVAVSGYSRREHRRRLRRQKRRRKNRFQRVGIAVAAIMALGVIWFPLSGATALHESETEAANGDLSAALEQAENAADAQPYAASPRLQEAVILELQGRLPAAAAAAAAATNDESTNWRTWLILARIQAEQGHTASSIRSYRRAR